MDSSRIALVVDSCTDVPPEDIERFGMYVVPLQVNYRDETFLDKVTITPQQVYDRFAEEVPTTSTPTPAGRARCRRAWWPTVTARPSSSPYRAGSRQPTTSCARRNGRSGA